MKVKRLKEMDFTAGLLIAVIITAGIILYIYSLGLPYSKEAAANQAPPPANSSQAKILKPATVPPKVAECSQPLAYSSGGNISPYQCSNGDLNVNAWEALSGLELKVMSLGYNPSASLVRSTLCRDAKTNAAGYIEQTAYLISALYYGWNFGSNGPDLVLLSGTC